MNLRVAGPEFGAELDRVRRARGVTFARLAAESGLSETYLGDLVRGRRGYRPTLETLERIAAGLGVPPDTFYAYRVGRVVEDAPPAAIDALYSRLAAGQ